MDLTRNRPADADPCKPPSITVICSAMSGCAGAMRGSSMRCLPGGCVSVERHRQPQPWQPSSARDASPAGRSSMAVHQAVRPAEPNGESMYICATTSYPERFGISCSQRY